MEPFSLAAFGIGLGSSILGAKFGFDQADLMRQETAEQVRRFTMYARHQEGAATAAGAESGITSDSHSLTKYLSDMTAEFTRQADWMKQSGNRAADLQDSSTLFNALSSFGGSLFSYGQSNSWFRSPTIR